MLIINCYFFLNPLTFTFASPFYEMPYLEWSHIFIPKFTQRFPIATVFYFCQHVVWYLGIIGLLLSTKSFLILYLHFNNSQKKTTVAKFSVYLLANKLNFPTYILFYFYLHYKERSLSRVFHDPTKILHDQLSRNVTKKSSSTGPPSEKYLLFFIISTFLSCLLWRH